MIKHLITILLIACTFSVQGQQIKGFVHDLANSEPLYNVEIKNLRTNTTVLSDRNGSFTINGQVNDYLAVNFIGYIADTIFYYDEAIRRIYLTKNDGIVSIDEVLVKRFTDNLLSRELEKARNAGKIVEVPRNQGGIRISPSRLFGRDAKQARSNVEILEEEYHARKIDQRFTRYLITSLLPLSAEEIALFKERFRPTLEFVEHASDEDLKVYIIESYTVFKNERGRK